MYIFADTWTWAILLIRELGQYKIPFDLLVSMDGGCSMSNHWSDEHTGHEVHSSHIFKQKHYTNRNLQSFVVFFICKRLHKKAITSLIQCKQNKHNTALKTKQFNMFQAYREKLQSWCDDRLINLQHLLKLILSRPLATIQALHSLTIALH